MRSENNKNKRVVVAMSGGVDSSVAAALLKNQGYDVVGIFMKLWAEDADKTDFVRENVCCSVEAASAARAVASQLKIPFYVVNFAEEFKKRVVDYYIKEYDSGRTPNPCVICNRDIKGEILMHKVEEIGGDYLATGHYARIEDSRNVKVQNSNVKSNPNDKNLKSNVNYQLLKSKDSNKDQTYFLWTLSQEKLAKLLFPIGHLTKPEVRKIAAKMNLPTAERRESQGICFIPDRDVAGFLRRHAQNLTKPGPIVDIHGNELGIHDGLINYTIGQRERLGLGGPRAYFVVRLDSKKNTLVVGDDSDLYHKELIATNLNWIDSKKLNSNIKAVIRYRHPAEECRLQIIDPKKIKVIFSKPERAITPGQSIVFYRGDEVLGGGIIN